MKLLRWLRSLFRRPDLLPPADPRCERSAVKSYMDSLKQWRT